MAISYRKIQPKNMIHISDIVTIHYYELDASFTFAGEQHDFWEMVYVDTGCVAVQAEQRQLFLYQGDILFHKPNEFHAIRSHQSNPNFFVISFVCRSSAMRFFEGYHGTLCHSLKPFISAIIAEAHDSFHIPKNDIHLAGLTRRADAKPGGEQLVKTYLEQLLILLARVILEQREDSIFPAKEAMESQLVLAIKGYVQGNLTARISLDDLSANTGYSKSYLSRIFRQQCGTTIGKYITAQKITYAKVLIRSHAYSIAQIAELLGFDTSQYFAGTFKRETGMTPTEFKRSLDIH